MSKVGIRSMKPRIFVSSTFYDLRYIREDLSNFIKAHDFDPILFEDGDIGYTPGKSLDSSCYETMKSSDIVILIIGGLYGSPAEGEVKQKFKEYMSVTRNEFRSAISEGIPVFAFIDAKVYSEYAVYEANINEIEEEKINIKFSSTKDINIFRFIKEIKNIGNISITEFSKLADIKDFLSKQWADMFKNYLELLRENSANKKMTDSVEQMKILMDKMNVMLDTVGKKILAANNSNEYEEVVEKQRILAFAAELVDAIDVNIIDFIEKVEERKLYIEKLVDALRDSIKTDVWEKFRSDEDDVFMEFYDYFTEKGIDLLCCEEEFDDRIKKNIDIFEKENLKRILVDEISEDKNYETLF